MNHFPETPMVIQQCRLRTDQPLETVVQRELIREENQNLNPAERNIVQQTRNIGQTGQLHGNFFPHWPNEKEKEKTLKLM